MPADRWGVVATALLALSSVQGCTKEVQAADPVGDLMQRGLVLMYQSSDPVSAEAVFREILLRNPAHYGAHYQLAVALDRGGRPHDARPQWQHVLHSAQGINDTATLRVARERLASPDTASEGALMTLGVDLLHRQGDAARALVEFRKVLERNPQHYGATYQAAVAHDRLGDRVGARPYWQRVLRMAQAYRDAPVAETARARLAAP